MLAISLTLAIVLLYAEDFCQGPDLTFSRRNKSKLVIAIMLLSSLAFI
jgi:hypothetical protein